MENEVSITHFLILFTGGVFLVVSLICFYILSIRSAIKRIRIEEQKKQTLQLQHQTALLTNSVLTQEKERQRIAANLHDDVIAQLHRIQLLNQDTNLKPLLKESILVTRQISHDLSPPLLTATPMKELLLDFIHPFQKTYTLSTWFNINQAMDLKSKQKLHVFRIFQELVTNINKHANATHIELLLKIGSRYFCLILKDNGIGLPKNHIEGLGLKNIDLRNSIVNGKYRIKQNQPTGTTFLFLIKYHE